MPISLSLFMTGYAMQRMESGFLFSIISMMSVFFMELYLQARVSQKVAILVYQDGGSWRISPAARMGRSS
jgi:hypothetical protein